MEEKWNIKNASVLRHKIIQINPLLFVDQLVHDRHVSLTGSWSFFLFVLSYVRIDVSNLLIYVVLIFFELAHEVPVHLHFYLYVPPINLAITRN